MSILDRMQQAHEQAKEAGADMTSSQGEVIEVKANAITRFPVSLGVDQLGNEPFEGAIRTQEIVLVEAARRPQRAGGWAKPHSTEPGAYYSVGEWGFALPGAQLGVMIEDEFVLLPPYTDDEWTILTARTPMVSGQLLNAKAEELDRLHTMLEQCQFIPRKENPNAGEPRDISMVPDPHRVTWQLEAKNPQADRAFGRNLQARIRNGIQMEAISVSPPNADKSQRNDADAVVFESFHQSLYDNIDRRIYTQAEADEALRKTGTTFVTSLTGATDGQNDNTGKPTVYVQRATIGAFVASLRTGPQSWDSVEFSLWNPKEKSDS